MRAEHAPGVGAPTMGALGLESKTVRVVPYDPRWKELFVAEAARLQEILAKHRVELRLEHTGSTAIPGIVAKPILDILAGRDTLASREAIIAAIKDAGYLYRGEQGIPERDFFRRGEPRQYHLHLAAIGSEFWNDHRTFRDHLRSHPEDAAEYGALKQDLAARFPTDRESYIEGKTEFVSRILERARLGRSRV